TSRSTHRQTPAETPGPVQTRAPPSTIRALSISCQVLHQKFKLKYRHRECFHLHPRRQAKNRWSGRAPRRDTACNVFIFTAHSSREQIRVRRSTRKSENN